MSSRVLREMNSSSAVEWLLVSVPVIDAEVWQENASLLA